MNSETEDFVPSALLLFPFFFFFSPFTLLFHRCPAFRLSPSQISLLFCLFFLLLFLTLAKTRLSVTHTNVMRLVSMFANYLQRIL